MIPDIQMHFDELTTVVDWVNANSMAEWIDLDVEDQLRIALAEYANHFPKCIAAIGEQIGSIHATAMIPGDQGIMVKEGYAVEPGHMLFAVAHDGRALIASGPAGEISDRAAGLAAEYDRDRVFWLLTSDPDGLFDARAEVVSVMVATCLQLDLDKERLVNTADVGFVNLALVLRENGKTTATTVFIGPRIDLT